MIFYFFCFLRANQNYLYSTIQIIQVSDIKDRIYTMPNNSTNHKGGLSEWVAPLVHNNSTTNYFKSQVLFNFIYYLINL